MPYSPEHLSLCGTQVHHYLPASWSGVCTLVFISPDLRVIHGEESLPILVVDTIPTQQKKTIHSMPFLVTAGITIGVGTGTVGLTI